MSLNNFLPNNRSSLNECIVTRRIYRDRYNATPKKIIMEVSKKAAYLIPVQIHSKVVQNLSLCFQFAHCMDSFAQTVVIGQHHRSDLATGRKHYPLH